MRFMMLMIPKGYESATPGTVPDAKAVKAMMKYNEALQKAGVLITLDGLHPPSMGRRCRRPLHRVQGGTRRLLDDRRHVARGGDRLGQEVPGLGERDHRNPPGAGNGRFL